MAAATTAPSILCVHQGFELYGSDRTFVQSLRAIRGLYPEGRLSVVLPREGPLSSRIAPLADELTYGELFVLRRSEFRSRPLASLVRLARAVPRAAAAIGRHDLGYVNTVVVADHVLGARLTSTPVIVHVHELPVGPERWLFSAALTAGGATLVFNSAATARALPTAGRRRFVVHNGVPRPETDAPVAGEGVPARPLRILLPGRFSSWKGQELLLDAVSRLDRQDRGRIRVRLVGDAFPGQEHRVSRMRDRIREGELQDTVALEGFADDPTALYHWSDLVVMPSLKPEPFGMVAIEAMSHGRPVVAADHGGLREIVADGETGRRFRPRDPDALAGAMRAYLENPSLLAEHGEAGRRRQRDRFDERSYSSGIGNVIRDAIDRERDGAIRPGRRREL